MKDTEKSFWVKSVSLPKRSPHNLKLPILWSFLWAKHSPRTVSIEFINEFPWYKLQINSSTALNSWAKIYFSEQGWSLKNRQGLSEVILEKPIVFLYLNCQYRMPETKWLINNKNLFFAALSNGITKIIVPLDCVWWKPAHRSESTVFLLCPHLVERQEN